MHLSRAPLEVLSIEAFGVGYGLGSEEKSLNDRHISLIDQIDIVESLPQSENAALKLQF